ncbi:MAG: amino acid permease [Propionibacteriales bacterium]|nr:amino acid permease [Propionibacteriales bacterium]
MPGDPQGITRRLPVEMAMLRVSRARHRLPRLFGTPQLVILGLGVMIGAGIFSLSGVQAAVNAGPAVILSFVIGGVVCGIAALSYAELSSTIPVAGSAYTFSYVAFGEIWGWLVGWALILELLVAAALVARAWSSYFIATLDGFEVTVPDWLLEYGQFDSDINIVAPALLLLLTLLIVTGTRLSARVLTLVVLAKVAVILFVIVVGARYIDRDNYTPFVPERSEIPNAPAATVFQTMLGETSSGYGITGVFMAAGVLTFAYIGFDLIATAAEDTREPRRSVPRGMLIGLAMVGVLYVAMAAVMVGLRPYAELATGAPVSDALRGVGVDWAADVVNVGGLLAFTTVIMVVLIAQSRVLFAMGRDGLLPRGLSRVSSFSAPSRAAVTAGLAAIVLALYPQIGELEQLLVLGALFAFFFCAVGVVVLRRTNAGLERGFRVPLVPAVPVLSALLTIWLSLNLTLETWRNFVIWMAVGLALYLVYGAGHSVLATAGGDDHLFAEGADDAADVDEPVHGGRHRGKHAR